MNPLAGELNDTIKKENRYVFEMLSTLGKEMYFPKGILTQSAEAKTKAKKFNATLGVATEGGHMMFLPSLMKQLGPLSPDETLNYAPVAGPSRNCARPGRRRTCATIPRSPTRRGR